MCVGSGGWVAYDRRSRKQVLLVLDEIADMNVLYIVYLSKTKVIAPEPLLKFTKTNSEKVISHVEDKVRFKYLYNNNHLKL